MFGGGQAKSKHVTDLESTVAKARSEEHTSELQSLAYLVCRLLLEKKKKKKNLIGRMRRVKCVRGKNQCEKEVKEGRVSENILTRHTTASASRAPPWYTTSVRQLV